MDFLIGVLLILLIALAIIVILYFFLLRSNNNTTPTQQCSSLLTNVVDVTNSSCCVLNGNLTSYHVLEQYGMIVGPTPTTPELVCPLFCSGIYNPANETCSISSDNQAISTCFSLTVPSDCNGIAKPVARVGSIPYYAVAPLKNSFCNTTSPC